MTKRQGGKVEGKEYVSKQVNYYNNLLKLFAKDLSQRGISLIIISVNNQLDAFPQIKNTIRELHNEGYLNYLEVEPWFVNVVNYSSPEGHHWGKIAHYIIGEKLARYIKNNYPISGPPRLSSSTN